MSDFNATKYVKDNSKPLNLPDHSRISLRLRCIDDRSSDSEDRERPISVPGGALGIVMDVLGACTLLRRAGKHVTVEPKQAVEAVSQAIGPILYHTDEKSVKNRGIECGGCGHCNGALTYPSKYLLTEDDAKYFVEEGLREIKEDLKKFGVKPTVYKGGHAASAVIIVNGQDIDLPSVGRDGERIYVYHKDYHSLLLKLVSHEMKLLLSEHTQGVSEKELDDALEESAKIRLNVTLEKLTVGLPRFAVSKKENVEVAPI